MKLLLTVHINRDEDVVVARQRARQIADALGFGMQDQVRVATAVSEIARNVARYAGRGRVEFALDSGAAAFHIVVSDSGPGISGLKAILDGTYRSATGMGLGILGSRRIMDALEVDTAPGRGTTVRMSKTLPRRGAEATVSRAINRLVQELPKSAIEEVQQQNHELLAALEELEQRQEDLARLNAELQDTNRGVVALYAELDEKAEHLRRADETKSRFLSNITHEFQTPLNSILALTRLLLERTDGDLLPEQEKQVRFVREAAQNLSELVHDLLDLAKVEAGKVTVRPTAFTVAELFGALRGLMRPLQTTETVALVFDTDPPVALATLFTDDAKVSQILRNYISNALKFTERGEVRVSAALEEGGRITFRVTDTGIGIAQEDQARLFLEFGQVPNRLQGRVRGTGLGLSLSRRLASLLGGSVGMESMPGVGSTFWLRVPMIVPGSDLPSAPAAEGDAVRDTVPVPVTPETARAAIAAPAALPAPLALVVDDDPTARYVLRRHLTAAGCSVIEARGGEQGLARAIADRPDVIVLDLRMPDMLGTEVLARLKRDPATSHIPVIIATSQAVPAAERARLGAHAVAIIGKSTMTGGDGDGGDEIRRALRAANVSVPAQ